ncbi:hypothetical protein OSA18_00715, partial [Treponema pallidum]
KVYCRKQNAASSAASSPAQCPSSPSSSSSTNAGCEVAHGVEDPLCLAIFKHNGCEYLLIGGSRGYGEIKLEASSSGTNGTCMRLKESNVHKSPDQWDELSPTPKASAEQYRGTVGRFAVQKIYVVEKNGGGNGVAAGGAGCPASASSTSGTPSTQRPDLYAAVGESSDSYTGLWKFDTTTCSWNRE